MKTFGQIAYEGFENYSIQAPSISRRYIALGIPWESLPTDIRCAWDAAGIAVLNFLQQQQTKLPAQFPPSQFPGVNDGDVRVFPDPQASTP